MQNDQDKIEKMLKQEGIMKKAVFFALSAMLVAGCALGFNRHGDLVIVPTLPTTIEIEADQPYYQDGYYYSYRNEVWFYSSSQGGPWNRLPRDHYPREVRYRGHEEHRDHGDNDHH